jgi:hypothetical protein
MLMKDYSFQFSNSKIFTVFHIGVLLVPDQGVIL